ncbi:hypothetical protein [Saccharopolyspora phatthalungensis]|uniref:Uncharacterized protein n=1 Tax=Saccharopolyspora phatthalungensis TaxID=664693 RepID=A0A840Q490_9PSEU|nr:hypothetical protein [Saccharopolyspora phatthalungensis]MBB5154797.1 hypothetical protein [Saccharopolyspora phatthalungensis]
MADPADSVRRFRAALADAVSRSGRARGEAHQRAEDFQRSTTELARSKSPGSAVESSQRAAAAAYRIRMGLEIEEFSENEPNVRPATAPNGAAAGNSPEQTPSDGSDLDFSQARIMR